ncbi:phage tail protein [Paenibacillus sp. FJAT-26967]|uniref:phage tail protein n=1 Tax=Paenibacillus sp. FJAT-26967 TaxID=1729690 RepID=UPI000837AD58|nr:phage tail protein [Paenibacillus sp. FJAT-26967]
MIEIDGDMQAAQKAIEDIQRLAPKAVRAALTRAGQGVKTEAGRKIRETYTIKAKDVTQTIKVTRLGDMGLRLSSKGSNIPLIRFKTTPNSPQSEQPKVLKAAVKKGKKKPVSGAFVAQLGGHVGVVTRVGKQRLPIKELYGPAVPVMLGSDGVREHLEDEAIRRISERMNHELNRVLGR